MRKWLPFGKKLQAKNFEKIKSYGDTDVTSQFETHYQNLQVCFKWETKIMLNQLFNHLNKDKQLKRLGTKFYHRDRKFLNLTFLFFLCSFIIALQLRFLLEFPKKSAVSLNA